MIAVDELPVQLLRAGAVAPRRSRPGDAGLDLSAAEAVVLAPGERAKVPTGVAIALPDGVCGLVVPRSGLAARKGVAPFIGLVDPDFRGELCVTLHNHSGETFTAAAGERIAQLLLLPFWAAAPQVVEALPPGRAGPDARGEAGWGSSGR